MAVAAAAMAMMSVATGVVEGMAMSVVDMATVAVAVAGAAEVAVIFISMT